MACWLGSEDAGSVLGVTRRTLYRWRKQGTLLPGVHYSRTTTGKRSKLYFDIHAIRTLMQANALQ
jgi:predicted site-specific integrase-resolvase